MTSTSRGLAGTLLPVGLLLIAMASIQSGASLAKSMFPLVGAQGTTALRLFFAALILLLLLRPWRKRLSLQSLRSVVVYGIALGGMNLLFYLSVRTVPLGIAVALEFTGPLLVAGHQIALNFSALVFMIPYSLGMAVTVRVGHNLGAGLPRDARFAAGVGMAAALGYACVSASLMLLLREQIAAMYSPDPAVIAIAASLIVFSALFQFSDALQVTAAGALRGYQDTRVTMIMTLFAYWGIGLPVGYSLGLTDWFQEPTGPRGLWQGLVVGLTGAAIMLCIRLARSARRFIRQHERLQREDEEAASVLGR